MLFLYERDGINFTGKFNCMRRFPRRTLILSWYLVLTIAISVGTVIAGNLVINSGNGIEFGVGSKSFDTCSTSPRLEVDSAFGSDNVLYVSQLTLTEIPVVCDGQKLELRLLNSSGQQLASINWTLDKIDSSDTSITAIANGTSTSAANTSPSTVSVNYPDPSLNEPDAGLTLQSISVANVSQFSMNNSD